MLIDYFIPESRKKLFINRVRNLHVPINLFERNSFTQHKHVNTNIGFIRCACNKWCTWSNFLVATAAEPMSRYIQPCVTSIFPLWDLHCDCSCQWTRKRSTQSLTDFCFVLLMYLSLFLQRHMLFSRWSAYKLFSLVFVALRILQSVHFFCAAVCSTKGIIYTIP